jgi:antitoxin component of RelBE/YafQ-DinJ toxin-antitoxin module
MKALEYIAKTKPQKQMTSTRLDPDLRDEADHVARKLGVTTSKLIEAALRMYLDVVKKEIKK